MLKIDRFIKKLLPKDDKFFMLLEEAAANLRVVGEVLKEITTSTIRDQLVDLVNRIKELEHTGDRITHNIFHELNLTFLTPFDREDIHYLASALDDVLDNITISTGKITSYKIEHIPWPMRQLINIIYDSICELEQGVGLLKNLHDTTALNEVIRKVNTHEDQADSIFDQAIAELFEQEKDAIALVKLKEIYVSLEIATDKCEDAANVLESILIKNA